MSRVETLDRGRESYRRQHWTDVYADLSAADQETPLEAEDLERLATSASLLGKDAESTDFWVRAHQEFLTRNLPQRAASSALWLAFGLVARGEMAPAGGWLARAGRLLEGVEDCAEKGFLLAQNAIPIMFGGDPGAAYPMLEKAAEIGDRFRDPNVAALARLGQGECRIRLGEPAAAMRLFDEVMVAVTAGEVSPVLTGLVYCGVITACNTTFDLRRAQEWTAALTRWCDSQSGLVAYRGVCLVHRAEILQLKGAWPSAADEAQQACERLSNPPPGHASAGSAFYRRGELHRLRGEYADAEEAYRQASQAGRKPDPGLAELRLAQGQVEVAAAAIRRVAEEARDPGARSRILPAYVEILLAAGDVAAARSGAEELSEIAAALDAPFVRALSSHAKGAVLLADGKLPAALAALREAATGWLDLDVPYEAARVRLLVGLACRRLGDEETAGMEFEAARRTFQELGAGPDLHRADQLWAADVVAPAPVVRQEPAPLKPGSRLGPYEIVSSLGAGGMGEVFRARDTRLGRDVAVKILTAALAGDPDSVRRFEKEARAVAALSHPNVVPLFDVGEQDGIRYAVSEYVEGETLRARLKREPMPPGEAADVAAQIAEGLSAAHQKGFVHRDIKPENVILAHATFARILDFGLAKRSAGLAALSVSEEDVTQSAFLTEPGIIAGTVGYMSPEQVRGEPVDGRSDIFSLGVVLWEMLTGHRPFRGDSPVDTLSAILREEPPPDPALAGLPSEFERILRRALQKRPADRYVSAADLAVELRRLAADVPTVAKRRPGLASALRTWLRPSGNSKRS